VTAVPSVPVPDLDTIRERAAKATRWRGRPLTARAIAANSEAARDVPALIAALESTQARLVAVEAERDTLAAKIEAEAIEAALLPLCDDDVTEPGEPPCLIAWSAHALARRLSAALSVVPGEREDKT
jgi:hypothetical protein